MILVPHPCQKIQENEKRGMKIKHHCLLTTSVFFLHHHIYNTSNIGGRILVSEFSCPTRPHSDDTQAPSVRRLAVEIFFRHASVSSTTPM